MALAPPGLSNPFSTTRRVHHFNSFTQPYTILRLSSSSSFKIRSSTKSIVAAAVKENNFGALEKKKTKKKNWMDFTSLNYWVVRDYYRLVDSVNSLEHHIQTLSDEELAAKTEEFRHRLARQGETLAQIQPEAFAVVREAAKRKLGMRHFDVQIIGGAVLHDGSIAGELTR